jgi:hypothetical protein
MKKTVKKWALKLIATGLLIIGFLLLIILNPRLTYAHKSTHDNYVVFHDNTLDKFLVTRIDQATKLVRKSECYNPELKLEICLNDDSKYTALIKNLLGDAFARGFLNKIVLWGNADAGNNFIEIRGYKWNMAQLLSHEAIHCFQFDRLGLLRSNPIGKIPDWKYEGYPEYIARQGADQTNLFINIKRLKLVEKTENNGWIKFADSTGTVISYYKYWMLVQYCMDIKNMSYHQILADTTKEITIENQMMSWYQKQCPKQND